MNARTTILSSIIFGAALIGCDSAFADCFLYSTGAITPLEPDQTAVILINVLNNDAQHALTYTATEYQFPPPAVSKSIYATNTATVAAQAVGQVAFSAPGLFEIEVYVSGGAASSALVTLQGYDSEGNFLPQFRILQAELSGGHVPCLHLPPLNIP